MVHLLSSFICRPLSPSSASLFSILLLTIPRLYHNEPVEWVRIIFELPDQFDPCGFGVVLPALFDPLLDEVHLNPRLS